MPNGRKKAPKNPLHAIFLRRLHQELEERGLSVNALSDRLYAPPQRTLADVMNGADPRLSTIYGLCVALQLNICDLFSETRGGKGVVFVLPQQNNLPSKKQISKDIKGKGLSGQK